MSDEYPIKATLKGGQGYDAPWLTVDATDPLDLVTKLKGIAGSEAVQTLVDVANTFKAANNAGPLLPQGQEAAPQAAPQQAPQQSAWGQQPQQQQAPQGGFGGPQNGTPHPSGQQCTACGAVLQYKAFTSKAGRDIKMWSCPNGRAKGDGHVSEFVR